MLFFAATPSYKKKNLTDSFQAKATKTKTSGGRALQIGRATVIEEKERAEAKAIEDVKNLQAMFAEKSTGFCIAKAL